MINQDVFCHIRCRCSLLTQYNKLIIIQIDQRIVKFILILYFFAKYNHQVIYLFIRLMAQHIQKLSQQSFFFKWLLEQKDISLMASPSQVSQCEKENLEISPEKIVSSEYPQEAPRPALNHSKSFKIRQQRKNCYQKSQKIQKDKTFNPKTQKKNRNVLSNLVHHLLKFLNERNKSEAIVQKIIEIHDLDISISDCYEFFQKLQEKFKGYVTQKNMTNLWIGDFQSDMRPIDRQKKREFAKLIRVLSSKFYRQQCFPSIALSNKLSHDSKFLHYKGLRDICQLLFMIVDCYQENTYQQKI